nr:cellulose binding domain-containing protein [Micromonospora sp. DSM 115978]
MIERYRPSNTLRRPGVVATALAVLVVLGGAGGAPAQAAQADTEPPGVPGAIEVAEISETRVRLTWTASTDNVGVSRYEVYQYFTDIAILHTTPTNSITFTGLAASRTYTFQVRAFDAAGNGSASGPSLRLTMPPGDDQAPTVPGRPTVTSLDETTVTLTWPRSTDNVYVALYEVLRIDDTGTTVVAYAPQHPPTGPTARVGNLSPGTTYRFAVRARDDAGNYSAASEAVTVTTAGGPAARCAISYRIAAEWSGAFQAEVRVRNTGSVATDGWTLTWSFAGGQRIQYLWGGVLAGQAAGAVTIRNASWNGSIAPGGEAWFGFVASRPGSNAAPTAFQLNGEECALAAG